MKNSMHRYRKTFKFQSHHNWNWFSFFQNDSLWLKIFNILRHNWWIIFVVHPGSDYSLQTQTLNRQKEYWGMRMQIHFQTVSAAEMVCNMLNTRQSSKSVKKKKKRRSHNADSNVSHKDLFTSCMEQKGINMNYWRRCLSLYSWEELWILWCYLREMFIKQYLIEVRPPRVLISRDDN